MKPFLNDLVGKEVVMNDGRKLTIAVVGDFEPSDRSVGIMGSSVFLTLSDGTEVEMFENGDISEAESVTVNPIGKGPGYDEWGIEPKFEMPDTTDIADMKEIAQEMFDSDEQEGE